MKSLNNYINEGIAGKIKRGISRIVLGDIVQDPEKYVQKIVEILKKDYHDYWYASGFDWYYTFSTKQNYYELTQPWSKIKKDDKYFIRDTFEKQFNTSEVKDTDRFLCIKYKEPAYFGFATLYNYAVIPVLFNDKDIMLLPYRSHKFKDGKQHAVFVETEEEIKEILIDPVIKSLEKAAKPTVFRELTKGEVAYIDGMCGD